MSAKRVMATESESGGACAASSSMQPGGRACRSYATTSAGTTTSTRCSSTRDRRSGPTEGRDDDHRRLRREEVRHPGGCVEGRRHGDAEVGQRPLRRPARLDLADGRHHRLDEVSRGGRRLHHVHAHAGADELVVQDHRRVPRRRPLQHEADHAAAAEGALRSREERGAVSGELHPDRVRLEGELRAAQLLLAGKIDAKKAAAASEQVAAADPPHEPRPDRELRHVGEVVQVGDPTGRSRRVPGSLA